MPVIKSAKKKLRKDILREKRNNTVRVALKRALIAAKKKATEENINNAIKIADKAAKNNIIHANKAGRIKSRLSKLITKKPKAMSAKKLKNKLKSL